MGQWGPPEAAEELASAAAAADAVDEADGAAAGEAAPTEDAPPAELGAQS